MSTALVGFDDGDIYAWLDQHRSHLQKIDFDYSLRAHSPFGGSRRRILPTQTAYRLLGKCIQYPLSELRGVCASMSIDFWLPFLRKFDHHLRHWSVEWADSWIGYATLAVLKWSSWSGDSTYNRYWTGNTYKVATAVSNEDLIECFRIASLARIVCLINGQRRWVGKGARLVVNKKAQRVEFKVSQEVKDAVNHYERRRPSDSLFADQGLLEWSKLQEDDGQARYFLTLKQPIGPVRVEPSGKEFNPPYVPVFRDARFLWKVLRPYDAAIEDLYGVSVEEILHVLRSIANLFDASLPVDHDEPFVFHGDIEDDAFRGRLEFLLSLGVKGFVRFPAAHFEQRLAGVSTEIFATPEECRSAVSRFLKAFSVSEEDREKINIERLDPLPLCWRTPGGDLVWDLLWMDDFLSHIVRSSRETWFRSQQGDRFNLALKRYLLENTDCRIPSLRGILSTGDESKLKADIDLIVVKGTTALAVECKAYTKSREFWAGEPRAVRARRAKMNEWVAQAKKARTVLESLVSSGHSDLQDVDSVDWVICQPTQEYLRPLEVHGMLDVQQAIPRICTPEELVKYLNTVARGES